MHSRRWKMAVGVMVVMVGVWVGGSTAWAGPYPLWRVSLSSEQTEGNAGSSEPAIAATGRDIVFTSDASNLVAGDTNDRDDIFWHDRDIRTTERVSLANDGSQANGSSGHAALSFDGTVVAFHSAATNLVENDTNGFADVFVRDRLTNSTTRLSVAHDGGNPNASSRFPVMGGDGFQVAYESDAENLVEDDANSLTDVFLWDNGTTLLSRGLNGAPTNGSSHAPAVSAYANQIVFESVATNLVEGDTNMQRDIFLVDRETVTLERVSVSSDEEQANNPSTEAAISDDGRFVAFTSAATNLVPNDVNNRPDIFLRDRLLGTTIRITPNGVSPNGHSMTPVVASSGDAALVVFASEATNFVPNDTNGRIDIYAYHTATGEMRRVSETMEGEIGNNNSVRPAVSVDFTTILFTSDADNLVADDGNAASDVFVESSQSPTAVTLSGMNTAPSPVPLLIVGVIGIVAGYVWWRKIGRLSS